MANNNSQLNREEGRQITELIGYVAIGVGGVLLISAFISLFGGSFGGFLFKVILGGGLGGFGLNSVMGMKKDREEEAAAEAERLRQEEERKARIAAAEAERARKKQEQIDAFESTLAELKRVPINLGGDLIAPLGSLGDLPELKYSSLRAGMSKDSFLQYVAVDVETTGLSAARDEIIQLSAVRFDEFEPAAAFSTYIRPLKGLNPEAQAINGITEDMVENAPTIGEVLPSFIEFCGKSPLVGYNLPFNMKFLGMAGMPTVKSRKLYDVYPIMQRVLRLNDIELYDFKLDTVLEQTTISRATSHDALSDALATGCLFKLAVEEILG